MLYGMTKKFDFSAMRVLHVGANRCQEAQLYYLACALEVLWIEADPELEPDMQRALSGYHSQTYIIALPLGPEQCGTKVEFHIANNDRQSSSVLRFNKHTKFFPEVFMSKTVELEATTLDSLLPGRSFEWMTIDTQGSELLVLSGAERILADTKYVLTEVNVQELYYGCALLPRLDSFMAERGFIRTMTELKKRDENSWGNALYERMEIG